MSQNFWLASFFELLTPCYRTSALFLLAKLHWLPIDLGIKFRIAILTFKTLNLGQLIYLGNVIKRHVPGRALRSPIDMKHLIIPATITMISMLGLRFAAPTLWNIIPFEIRAL